MHESRLFTNGLAPAGGWRHDEIPATGEQAAEPIHALALGGLQRAPSDGDDVLLGANGYDDAWDALLATGEQYEPTSEVEMWMRENWGRETFESPSQTTDGEERLLTDISAISASSRAQARAWMRPFLDFFIAEGTIAEACRLAGNIHHSTPEKAAKVDSAFADEFAIARQIVADGYRREWRRRAVEGWEEPVYGRVAKDQDGEVGTIRKFSDSLLARGLVAYCSEFKPEETTTINNNVSASASAKTESMVVVSKEQLEKRQARQRKKLEHQVDRARLALGSTGAN